jgi:RNA polymerase sigma factor (TIGR02999 family)
MSGENFSWRPSDVSDQSREVSRLLAEWRHGNHEALERLMPLVYGELRKLAAYHLRAERVGHTLQPTALVHEAYLRLAGRDELVVHDRAHFVAIAAQVMRHILVDHARGRARGKRGGACTIVALDEAAAAREAREADLVALDDALTELSRLSPQQSRIVELRYFGGLTIEEIAEALGIAVARVRSDWTLARAWLRRELSRSER